MKERAIGHGQRELYGNTDEIGVAYVGEDDVLLVSNNGVIMNCVLVGIYIFSPKCLLLALLILKQLLEGGMG